VLTDVAAVDLAIPRDRNGAFEPQIVRKGQTLLDGFNERIIAFVCARDDYPGYPCAPVQDLWRRGVGRPNVPVTDAIAEELAEWLSRPLDGLPSGLYRRSHGRDQRWGCRQPLGLPGDRDRL
jgi:hypothetical protein